MSSIKGGGRVELSSDLEEAIVDHLRRWRDPNNPLVARKEPVSLEDKSAHDVSHNRKKFLKKLFLCHERRSLNNQLNAKSSGEGTTLKSGTSKASSSSLDTKRDVPLKGKVRLGIVEAVFKNPQKWKPGSTKKTMVFDRETNVEDFMGQAMSKLKMKKAARAFVLERKIEVDLLGNLQGLKDGTLVYVTKTPRSSADEEDDERNDQTIKSEPQTTDLETIKEVYVNRAQRRSLKVLDLKDYKFDDFLDQLPDLPASRESLPAAKCRTAVLKAVDQARVVIVSGATGSGKSTQVPQYLLEGMIAGNREADANVIVTQPRRVAAMALAERVAVERESPPPGKKGSTVGYSVRLDNSTTETTRITYLTLGVLLRKLMSPSSLTDADATSQHKTPPPLCDVSHLVIDEVHERDVDTDFCLTILRRVLVANRQLKVILMSATNTPDLFVDYFTSPRLQLEPIVLSIPGRTFPVDIVWQNEIEKLIGKKTTVHPGDQADGQLNENRTKMSLRALGRIDDDFIVSIIEHLIGKRKQYEANAILVFLPGMSEIASLDRAINRVSKVRDVCEVHFMHSTIPKGQQRNAFLPATSGKTKVVLATNIAETSITIPDVSFVIDSGHVKEHRFNSSSNINELVTVWISRGSATQRAGRAGRTGRGTCFRLYTETFANKVMLARTPPEILRTPLDELVLQACLLEENQKDEVLKQQRARNQQPAPTRGLNPAAFIGQTPDPPPPESLKEACARLTEIGAVKPAVGQVDHLDLTPLGYHLSHLPMDARIGKILIMGSILGCIDASLTIAAALSGSKSIFRREKREEQKELIQNGFGGVNYAGGTVKGDTIAVVAAFMAWQNQRHSRRFAFAKAHGLDNTRLTEIQAIRGQYRERLISSGFLSKQESSSIAGESAILASCCLVSGMYPHIATLARPVKGKLGFKGGRLITRDGDTCTPESQSFQSERVRNAAESGRDAYAVYLYKQRVLGATVGTISTSNQRPPTVFLTHVNFVSRFSLLLFGGDLVLKDKSILVDGWLKFKVGDHGRTTAMLLTELRRDLDAVLLRQLAVSTKAAATTDRDELTYQLLHLVSRVLENE